MSDIGIDFGLWVYAPALLWVAIVAACTGALAVSFARRPIERMPKAPWKYGVGAFAINVLMTIVVCQTLRELDSVVIAFGLAVGLGSGGTLAWLSSTRRRTLVDTARALQG